MVESHETHAFDRATAVDLRSGGEDGPIAVYDTEVDAGWCIGTKPHGGYLMAILARAGRAGAARAEGLAHPDPVSSSATFLSAPAPGPAEAHVEVLRRGKRMSQVRSRLVQDGTARVEATFTLGRLGAASEPWWDDVRFPSGVTPEAECRRSPGVSAVGGFDVPLMERVEVRLDPAVAGFAVGKPTGTPEVRGWLRFPDGRPPDPLSLLLAVDVLPPATFELGTTGWVPTFELTAYVRRLPAPGPLLVRHRARLIEADMVDEACDVWDSRGHLVAQATQLAGVRVTGTNPPAR